MPTSTPEPSATAAQALPDPIALAAKPESKAISLNSLLMLGLLALIWGSSFILMKRGLTFFTPIEVGCLRMISAATLLLPLGLMRIKRIKRRHVGHMVMAGLIGSFIPAFLFATAGAHLDSAISGSLNALSPLFTLLLGILFFQTRTGWQGYAGILIGLAGAVALSMVKAGENTTLNAWALLVVAATIMYAFNVNHIKRSLQDADSIAITSVSFIPLGFLAAGILWLGTGFPAKVGQPGFWGLPLACVVTLGMVGSAISWILYNRLLKKVSALAASTVTYLMPVVSLAWGLADGERILAWHYIGLVLVLGGLGLVAMSGRR